jgi:hypothetical protein
LVVHAMPLRNEEESTEVYKHLMVFTWTCALLQIKAVVHALICQYACPEDDPGQAAPLVTCK